MTKRTKDQINSKKKNATNAAITALAQTANTKPARDMNLATFQEELRKCSDSLPPTRILGGFFGFSAVQILETCLFYHGLNNVEYYPSLFLSAVICITIGYKLRRDYLHMRGVMQNAAQHAPPGKREELMKFSDTYAWNMSISPAIDCALIGTAVACTLFTVARTVTCASNEDPTTACNEDPTMRPETMLKL